MQLDDTIAVVAGGQVEAVGVLGGEELEASCGLEAHKGAVTRIGGRDGSRGIGEPPPRRGAQLGIVEVGRQRRPPPREGVSSP